MENSDALRIQSINNESYRSFLDPPSSLPNMDFVSRPPQERHRLGDNSIILHDSTTIKSKNSSMTSINLQQHFSLSPDDRHSIGLSDSPIDTAFTQQEKYLRAFSRNTNRSGSITEITNYPSESDSEAMRSQASLDKDEKTTKPDRGNLSSTQVQAPSKLSKLNSNLRKNILSGSPLPDSPTIPLSNTVTTTTRKSPASSLRSPGLKEREQKKGKLQIKRLNRTLDHISAFIPINVVIHDQLTIPITAEKSKTIEQLARQIEAEYTFKYYDVHDDGVGPLEIGLLYDEGMIALRFRDLVGDVLDIGTTVHVLNVYEGDDADVRTIESSYNARESTISASSGLAISERSRRTSLPASLLMAMSNVDSQTPPLSSETARLSPLSPSKMIRSLSHSAVSLYSGSDRFSIAGLDERFRAILNNTLALRYFARFALSEFSVENLLFHIDVELFSNGYKLAKNPDDDEYYDDVLKDDPDYAAQVQAEFIYVCYIADDSPLQVNLPDEIRRDIKDPRTIEQADRHMFDEAQEAVFQLMKGHTYVQFESSDLFHQLLDLRKESPEFYRTKQIPAQEYISSFTPNIPMMLAMNMTMSDSHIFFSSYFREQVLTSALSQYFPEDPLAEGANDPPIIIPPKAYHDNTLQRENTFVDPVSTGSSSIKDQSGNREYAKKNSFDSNRYSIEPQPLDGYFADDNYLTTAQKVKKIRRRKKLQWIFGENVKGPRQSPKTPTFMQSQELTDSDDDEMELNGEEEEDEVDDSDVDFEMRDKVIRHHIARQIYEKKRQLDKVEAVLGAAPGRVSDRTRAASEENTLPKSRFAQALHLKKWNADEANSRATSPIEERRSMFILPSRYDQDFSSLEFSSNSQYADPPSTKNELSADSRRVLWKKSRKLRVLLGHALHEDLIQTQLTNPLLSSTQFDREVKASPTSLASGYNSLGKTHTSIKARRRRSSDPEVYSSYSPSPTKTTFGEDVSNIPESSNIRPSRSKRPDPVKIDNHVFNSSTHTSYDRMVDFPLPSSPVSPTHKHSQSSPVLMTFRESKADYIGNDYRMSRSGLSDRASIGNDSRSREIESLRVGSPDSFDPYGKEYRRRKMEKLCHFYGERVPISAMSSDSRLEEPKYSMTDYDLPMRGERRTSKSGSEELLLPLRDSFERVHTDYNDTTSIMAHSDGEQRDGLFTRWKIRKRSTPSPSRIFSTAHVSPSHSSLGSTSGDNFDAWRSTESLDTDRVPRNRFLPTVPVSGNKLVRKDHSPNMSKNILVFGGIGSSPNPH